MFGKSLFFRRITGGTTMRRSDRPGGCRSVAGGRKLRVEALEERRLLAAGAPDPSFDLDGRLTTAFGTAQDSGSCVAIQRDGKILVAGYAYNGTFSDFAVARYNANGSLDAAFDGDGKLTTDFGGSHDQACGLAVQSDGKIVVAGVCVRAGTNDFAVARYNTDGSLDVSFDGDGRQATDFGGSSDNGQSVALQSDGKILVAGYTYAGSNYDFAVVRYNTDGSLDTAFDGDGKLITAFGTSNDSGYSIAVQGDGKIVVAGNSHNGSDFDFAVARYNADGGLDASFDGDGKLTTALGPSQDVGYGLAIQRDGRILVAGFSHNGSNSDFALARYLADGTLDTTFDGDGKLTAGFGPSIDIARSVVADNGGKIVVAGTSDSGNSSDFVVARYNADGSLDSSFDGDGWVATDFGTSADVGTGVAFQNDGKIVVGGYSNCAGTYDFALARYEGVDGYDYGDAPNGYHTLEADSAAKHGATGPTLGVSRDMEDDGLPTTDADGDDANGTDDEDGVTFSTVRVGQLTTVTINVQNSPQGARLDAWMDFDADGGWNGPLEQIADNVAVTAGNNVLTVNVPSDAAQGTTVARFRLSLAGNLDFDGPSPDGEVEDYAIVILPAESHVVIRQVFYNNSAFDGSAVASNDRDYDAVAPGPSLRGHGHPGELNESDKELGKQPLLPGQTASLVNYSSYSKGINGIVIAFDNLARPEALTVTDFVFRVGNSDAPAEWPLAPEPLLVSPGCRIRVDQDVEGFAGQPDVVTITWADEDPYTPTREPGAISNQWLQVTVLANPRTGLAANDVVYFGNQLGESGNSPSDTNVDQNDEIGARNHPHTAFNPAAISDPYDFNRDGKVDQNDEILARNNPASAFTRITLISAPSMLQAKGVSDGLRSLRTASEPAPVLSAAITRRETTGLAAAQMKTLHHAAGSGWFSDPTLTEDQAFGVGSSPVSKSASSESPYGRLDLLRDVMHEMGQLLGEPDLQTMADDLTVFAPARVRPQAMRLRTLGSR